MAKPQIQISVKEGPNGGLDGLIARLTAPKNDILGRLEVGVISAEDDETAFIARVHEFGTDTIPQRSFLRSTLAANRTKYIGLSKTAMQHYTDGDWTMKKSLTSVGIEIQADIKKTIMKNVPPPLAEETVKAKMRQGLSRARIALYASGKLYNSIHYRIIGDV